MTKTLHLNLKRKWFDMIKSGEKKEEYRQIKGYYISRLLEFLKSDQPHHETGGEVFSFYHGFFGRRPRALHHILRKKYVKFKHFDTVTFSNGYAKDRDQFVIKLNGIKVNSGLTKWGAEPFTSYIILKLGKQIKTNKE